MGKEFDYVVAHLWDEDKPASGTNLAIYTYRDEIQHGTKKNAKTFLKYVQKRNSDEKWDIYKVSFEKF